jgi:hypothetical protein
MKTLFFHFCQSAPVGYSLGVIRPQLGAHTCGGDTAPRLAPHLQAPTPFSSVHNQRVAKFTSEPILRSYCYAPFSAAPCAANFARNIEIFLGLSVAPFLSALVRGPFISSSSTQRSFARQPGESSGLCRIRGVGNNYVFAVFVYLVAFGVGALRACDLRCSRRSFLLRFPVIDAICARPIVCLWRISSRRSFRVLKS